MPGVIDCDNSAANMYGCLPCPRCGSVYRAPFRDRRWDKHSKLEVPSGIVISCGDCGHEEEGRSAEGSQKLEGET
jgi:hypothetical protein